MSDMHRNSAINRYWCYRCNSKIIIPETVALQICSSQLGSAVVACREHIYPIVCGILLYSLDSRTQGICQGIQKGSEMRMLIRLLETNKLSKACVAVMLVSYIALVRLIRVFPSQSVRNFMHNCVTMILKLTSGQPRLWSYVQLRQHIPSFHLSLLTQSFIPKKGSVYADVGCGNGLLLRWIAERSPNTVTMGVDQSFIFLLLARLFIVHSHTLLVQGTVEQLPAKPGLINTLSINDAWQYIPKNNLSMNSIRTVTAKDCIFTLFHIYNPTKSITHEAVIRPTSASATLRLLHVAGFPYVGVFSNDALYEAIQRGGKINLKTVSKRQADLKGSYSIVASRRQLPTCIQPNTDILDLARSRCVRRDNTIYQILRRV